MDLPFAATYLKFSRISSGRWSNNSLTVNCACLAAPVMLSNLMSGSSSDESSESSTTGLAGGITVLSSCREIFRMWLIPGFDRLNRPTRLSNGCCLLFDRRKMMLLGHWSYKASPCLCRMKGNGIAPTTHANVLVASNEKKHFSIK